MQGYPRRPTLESKLVISTCCVDFYDKCLAVGAANALTRVIFPLWWKTQSGNIVLRYVKHQRRCPSRAAAAASPARATTTITTPTTARTPAGDVHRVWRRCMFLETGGCFVHGVFCCGRREKGLTHVEQEITKHPFGEARITREHATHRKITRKNVCTRKMRNEYQYTQVPNRRG